MERNLQQITFQLEQSEKKMGLLSKKISFLNKLLVVVSIVMLLLFISK